MPHYRYDEIHRQWVIFAPDRDTRPTDYLNPPPPVISGDCPFCPGNENQTPPELLALRPDGSAPNKPGWEIRVFPNKFPALTLDAFDPPDISGGPVMKGFGKHEVIVETPSHNSDFPDMTVEHLRRVLEVYRSRIYQLEADPGFKYAMLFRNFGFYAGATHSHPHAQLIAMPLVPSSVQTELEAAEYYFHQTGRCWFCNSLKTAMEDGSRLVAAESDIAAFAPFAPRMPFEIIIAPRKHNPLFSGSDEAGLMNLAQVLKTVIAKIRRIFPDICYNLLFHSAPFFFLKEKPDASNFYHWHIELLPRLVKTAGFEIGAGFTINPTTPESTAESLRRA